jgi:pimeloyl-ACP methyl ester carboxylesterase
MIPQDKYVKVGDINTRYWSLGDTGPVVLLIHGFASSVEYWMANIDQLAKNHRVYALDLVGFGRSDKPDIAYRGAVLAQFVKKFMAAQNIAKATLIGHSLGGAVTLYFAIRYPKLIDKLILVSSGGLGREISFDFRVLTLPFIGELILSIANRALLRKVIRSHVYNKDAISDDFIDRIYAILELPNTKRTMLAILRQHVDFFGVKYEAIKLILDNLSKIKNQTLIIWGRNDNLLPVTQSEIAIRHLPNAKLHIFENCGHIPQMECSEQFNDLVIRFIDEFAY